MLATLHVAEAYIVQALAWIRPEELPSHRLDYLLSWIRVWMGVYQSQSRCASRVFSVRYPVGISRQHWALHLTASMVHIGASP